ncbi:MAG TPA: hypothetical protein VG184_05740 [Acidimicrobiales bacterium]|nr:hypothetical protein [Acidimicrobiales bacterium]
MASTVQTASPPHLPTAPTTTVRRVAALMAVEALSLAVASALHLSGQVHGRSAPFDADHAGIAEALIAAVLGAAVLTMFRAPARARAVGIAATGFAIIGFLVGLSMTARGGDLPDIGYHVTVLPLLIGSLVVLVRAGRPPAGT